MTTGAIRAAPYTVTALVMGFLGIALALLASFVVGFATSVPPLGPIAALMIRRAAEGAHRHALRIGIGAALVECVFAATAAAALSFVSEHGALIHQAGFSVAAILFPLLGLRMACWRANVSTRVDSASERNGVWLGASVAALNPAPLVSWATFISLLHAWRITISGPLVPLFGVAGGAGVLSWNVILLGILKRHLGKLPVRQMTRFVRGIGVLLMLIGVWAALHALHIVHAR